MVRETSQWEREEMEKVVSERTETAAVSEEEKDGYASVKAVLRVSLL